MAENKIEYSSLSLRVIDVRDGADGKTHRYSKSIDNLAEILDQLKKTAPNLESSMIDIDPERSKKYQKIGIEKLVLEKENGITFYHFRLAYIKRDQNQIQVRDLQNGYKERKLKIGKTEYEYIPLHFSIVPQNNSILLDSKCHTAPSQQFIHKTVLSFLDAKSFDFSNLDKVDEHLRVKIIPNKAQKFEETLKKKLNSISQIGFTFARPRSDDATIDSELDNRQGSRRINEMLKVVTSKIFGTDYAKNTIDGLPIKKIQIQLIFDEKESSGLASKMKKAFATSSDEVLESRYLKDSLLVYHDDETEKTKRVLFGGLVTSYDSKLDKKQFDKSSKVWEEHREIYFRALKDMKKSSEQ